MDSGLLRADDVAYSYGSHAVLSGVSLAAPRGGIVGILGPNGSGKTTLLRILSGALSPSRGRITFDEQDVGRIGRTQLARRMAVVPQETHLAFDYSVIEIVLMGRYPHLGAFELEGPADVSIARAALAATGTSHLEQRSFMTLSGGEKQRVIIAGALAQFERRVGDLGTTTGTDVLLLDEPTASLDPAYQLEIGELLSRLNRDLRLTILVSTHDLNFAAGLCRELVLLRRGRVIGTGPIDSVLTPANIASLYGVEADVHRHPSTGRLTVVPLRRVPETADA